MLDLEQEIAGWRETMARGGVDDPVILDELESHLRDFIAQEVRAGRDVKSALRAGLVRIGPPDVLRREFSRANRPHLLSGVSALLRDRVRCFWTALTLSVLVAAGFYCWHMRVTPLYQSVATLHVFRGSQPPAMANDVQSAEDLGELLKLLCSQGLRAQVADSFTSTEQQIIRRTTAGHHAAGEPVPVKDLLGSLRAGAWGTSQTAWLSVLHEDPEAAALIANRYVEQCLRLFPIPSERSAPTIRQMDFPSPARSPATPDRTNTLQASAALALGIFAGLLIIAAVLRRFASTGLGPGPQMKTT